ncbi:MAG: class I SAM-dependent methyltransferase [Longimicrobiales bacterium]
MSEATPGHHVGGWHRVLDKAGVYVALQNLLLRKGSRERYVREFVRPFRGCRILDIGCGPGDILAHLPESIGVYVGFDINPEYIAAARRRWGARGTFRCEKVDVATFNDRDTYDIVLANGIVHHLDDDEARYLFDMAHRALRPGGWLVTYDNVYVEGQHWFARWLIGRDRGKAVRTGEGYATLARGRFTRIESALLHKTLRVPYTIWIMRCTKTG